MLAVPLVTSCQCHPGDSWSPASEKIKNYFQQIKMKNFSTRIRLEKSNRCLVALTDTIWLLLVLLVEIFGKPTRRAGFNESAVMYYSMHPLLFIYIFIGNNNVCQWGFRTDFKSTSVSVLCAVCVCGTKTTKRKTLGVCAHLVRFWLVKQTIGIKIRNPRTGQSVDKDLINWIWEFPQEFVGFFLFEARLRRREERSHCLSWVQRSNYFLRRSSSFGFQSLSPQFIQSCFFRTLFIKV
jgi:hypothetical protein